MFCWEITNCGRVPGGHRVEELGVCPAYPDDGEKCARQLDSCCEGNPADRVPMRLHQCLKCEFYYSDHYKPQVEDFDTCAACGGLIQKGTTRCAPCGKK